MQDDLAVQVEEKNRQQANKERDARRKLKFETRDLQAEVAQLKTAAAESEAERLHLKQKLARREEKDKRARRSEAFFRWRAGVSAVRAERALKASQKAAAAAAATAATVSSERQVTRHSCGESPDRRDSKQSVENAALLLLGHAVRGLEAKRRSEAWRRWTSATQQQQQQHSGKASSHHQQQQQQQSEETIVERHHREQLQQQQQRQQQRFKQASVLAGARAVHRVLQRARQARVKWAFQHMQRAARQAARTAAATRQLVNCLQRCAKRRQAAALLRWRTELRRRAAAGASLKRVLARYTRRAQSRAFLQWQQQLQLWAQQAAVAARAKGLLSLQRRASAQHTAKLLRTVFQQWAQCGAARRAVAQAGRALQRLLTAAQHKAAARAVRKWSAVCAALRLRDAALVRAVRVRSRVQKLSLLQALVHWRLSGAESRSTVAAVHTADQQRRALALLSAVQRKAVVSHTAKAFRQWSAAVAHSREQERALHQLLLSRQRALQRVSRLSSMVKRRALARGWTAWTAATAAARASTAACKQGLQLLASSSRGAQLRRLNAAWQQWKCVTAAAAQRQATSATAAVMVRRLLLRAASGRLTRALLQWRAATASHAPAQLRAKLLCSALAAWQQKSLRGRWTAWRQTAAAAQLAAVQHSADSNAQQLSSVQQLTATQQQQAQQLQRAERLRAILAVQAVKSSVQVWDTRRALKLWATACVASSLYTLRRNQGARLIWGLLTTARRKCCAERLQHWRVTVASIREQQRATLRAVVERMLRAEWRLQSKAWGSWQQYVSAHSAQAAAAAARERQHSIALQRWEAGQRRRHVAAISSTWREWCAHVAKQRALRRGIVCARRAASSVRQSSVAGAWSQWRQLTWRHAAATSLQRQQRTALRGCVRRVGTRSAQWAWRQWCARVRCAQRQQLGALLMSAASARLQRRTLGRALALWREGSSRAQQQAAQSQLHTAAVRTAALRIAALATRSGAACTGRALRVWQAAVAADRLAAAESSRGRSEALLKLQLATKVWCAVAGSADKRAVVRAWHSWRAAVSASTAHSSARREAAAVLAAALRRCADRSAAAAWCRWRTQHLQAVVSNSRAAHTSAVMKRVLNSWSRRSVAQAWRSWRTAATAAKHSAARSGQAAARAQQFSSRIQLALVRRAFAGWRLVSQTVRAVQSGVKLCTKLLNRAASKQMARALLQLRHNAALQAAAAGAEQRLTLALQQSRALAAVVAQLSSARTRAKAAAWRKWAVQHHTERHTTTTRAMSVRVGAAVAEAVLARNRRAAVHHSWRVWRQSVAHTEQAVRSESHRAMQQQCGARALSTVLVSVVGARLRLVLKQWRAAARARERLVLTCLSYSYISIVLVYTAAHCLIVRTSICRI
jgi:hypothetical protein